MPFELFHGDSIDDSAPWCPVCFDLDYQNLKTFDAHTNKADPGPERKGALRGFHLWWRGRRDFQQRAEQSACVFCTVLLQIVDRFWKRPASGRHADRFPVYSLNVFMDGSVEISSMLGFPRRPLGLLLYTPSGHPLVWGRIPPAPQISPSANSKRALHYLRRQLEICSEDHEECSYDCPVLPTRVLDVGTLETEQEVVKLIEPHPGTVGQFVALSYCWGDGSALQATKANLSELLQRVDEEELPATIRDAVELTRYIGVQYLWVDALCIIQDDTQDWIHESAQMSAVYAQAFLTISASSVASSTLSFLHQSRGNKEVLFDWQPPQSSADVQNTDSSADKSPVHGGMLAVRRTTLSGFHQDGADDIIDPAMTRAWTLQEHALSTRLVCFSTDEIQWTCRTLRNCECDHPDQHESPRLEQLQRDLRRVLNNGPIDPLKRVELQKQTFYEFWTKLVEAYCRRDLTCTRDKLPALSGLARGFFQKFNEARLPNMIQVPPLQYLAGLWNFELHIMLLWWSSHQGSQRTPFVKYRAPSWSWASVEGKVTTTQRCLGQGFQLQAEILSAVCTPANPGDPFGQVVREGTHLRLCATILETQIRLSRPAPTWGIEYMTPYGRVLIDDDLEDVPIDELVWGRNSPDAAAAAAATVPSLNDDNKETSEHIQPKTLQRVRQELEHSHYAAHVKSRAYRIFSGSASDSGSDDVSDKGGIYSRSRWEESNLGRDFNVWLVHVADEAADDESPMANLLVLGRPAGEEQVYERIGYLCIWNQDKWALDAREHPKSIVTIV